MLLTPEPVPTDADSATVTGLSLLGPTPLGSNAYGLPPAVAAGVVVGLVLSIRTTTECCASELPALSVAENVIVVSPAIVIDGSVTVEPFAVAGLIVCAPV